MLAHIISSFHVLNFYFALLHSYFYLLPLPSPPLLRCVILRTNKIPASKEVGGDCARINGSHHGGYRWNHLYLNRSNIIPSLLENLKLDLAVLTLLSVGKYYIRQDLCLRRGALGFAVLRCCGNSCGNSVILILNCGIAVFSKPAGCGFLAFWTV